MSYLSSLFEPNAIHADPGKIEPESISDTRKSSPLDVTTAGEEIIDNRDARRQLDSPKVRPISAIPPPPRFAE